MPKAVHHIAFTCHDRVKQEEFYTRVLGFRRARVFNPGMPDEFVMLRLGETCIELFSGATGRPAENTSGVRHLAFVAANLDEALERLRAAGVEAGPIIDCSGISPGMRVCFFKDPEGNDLEYMENWADETA